jgi:hypothetical protein
VNVRSKRPAPVVSRQYMYAPDYCARALALLLKEPVSKEVTRPAPEPGDRDGTKTLEDSANVILPD